MIKRFVLLLCVLTLGLGSFAFADEGMWLFNAFPKDQVQAKYGFAPDQAWLDHVRLSSARAPNGSSSFVSADGLIFTNHHIAPTFSPVFAFTLTASTARPSIDARCSRI